MERQKVDVQCPMSRMTDALRKVTEARAKVIAFTTAKEPAHHSMTLGDWPGLSVTPEAIENNMLKK